jgi:hypothetical protein
VADRYVRPKPGSRKLWELDVDKHGDSRPPNDRERDDICKALSLDDQIALMDKYGYPWPPS